MITLFDYDYDLFQIRGILHKKSKFIIINPGNQINVLLPLMPILKWESMRKPYKISSIIGLDNCEEFINKCIINAFIDLNQEGNIHATV